jgi:hypothetical protein
MSNKFRAEIPDVLHKIYEDGDRREGAEEMTLNPRHQLRPVAEIFRQDSELHKNKVLSSQVQ